MKISKLTVGQRVFDIQRRKMGNTTISSTDVFYVTVREIDPEGRWVLASWNGNTPEKFRERTFSKWREKEPMLVKGAFGSTRLATREELKAIREQAGIDTAQGTDEDCPWHLRKYDRREICGVSGTTKLTIKFCDLCARNIPPDPRAQKAGKS